jgi:hypothetical protein
VSRVARPGHCQVAVGRERDIAFVDAMLWQGFTHVGILRDRSSSTHIVPTRRDQLEQWLTQRQ